MVNWVFNIQYVTLARSNEMASRTAALGAFSLERLFFLICQAGPDECQGFPSKVPALVNPKFAYQIPSPPSNFPYTIFTFAKTN